MLGTHGGEESLVPVLLGHPRGRVGRDRVAPDVARLAFRGQAAHEADERRLGGGVGGEPMQAVQTGRRGGDHDAPMALRAHVRIGGVCRIQRPEEVDFHDLAEFVEANLVESLVLIDAGVGDQGVEPPPGLQGLGHHARARSRIDRVVLVRDRFSALIADLLRHPLRCAEAVFVDLPATVVHHYAQAAGGEIESVSATQATAGAGHDRDSFHGGFGRHEGA